MSIFTKEFHTDHYTYVKAKSKEMENVTFSNTTLRESESIRIHFDNHIPLTDELRSECHRIIELIFDRRKIMQREDVFETI